MNKARRKQLSNIAGQLEALKSELEGVQNDEQEYFDAMPESLQNSEKGETAQSAISELESAVSSVDELIGAIERAQD